MPFKDDSGTWVFPETWPSEARAAFESAHAALEAEREALAHLEDARAAAAVSPEAALLQLRIEADAVRAAAERTRIEAADDTEILALRAKYGARLRVVYTAAGSLVVVWTERHEALWDSVTARAKALEAAAFEANPPDPVRAEADSLRAFKEGYFEHVIVYPPKPRAKEILKAYSDAWPELYRARADLARGPREAAGKGVAH